MKARWWYPVAMLTLMVIASIVAGQHMPERVAVHFDLAGRPNRYGSKYTVLVLGPILALFIGGVMLMMRAIAVSMRSEAQVKGLFDSILNVVFTIFLALHLSILAKTLGYAVPLAPLGPATIGLTFIAIGRLLPGIPRNPIVGVRTPWTLQSGRVWERSQIVGARLMIAAGIISLAAALLPAVAGFVVSISSAIVAAIAITIYSYIASKREMESSQ